MFNKYLKYKNKYLELKKNRVLKGGAAAIFKDCSDTCIGSCHLFRAGRISSFELPPQCRVLISPIGRVLYEFHDFNEYDNAHGSCKIRGVDVSSSIHLNVGSFPIERILRFLKTVDKKVITAEATPEIKEPIEHFRKEFESRQADVVGTLFNEKELTNILYKFYYEQPLEHAINIYIKIYKTIKNLCPDADIRELNEDLNELDKILDGIFNNNPELLKSFGMIKENPKCIKCGEYCYSKYCGKCSEEYFSPMANASMASGYDDLLLIKVSLF
jgi:hypothetical protein